MAKRASRLRVLVLLLQQALRAGPQQRVHEGTDVLKRLNIETISI